MFLLIEDSQFLKLPPSMNWENGPLVIDEPVEFKTSGNFTDRFFEEPMESTSNN
jgi:hypothetical protein